jgi:glycosyltransferase involved in cell wall biosynthesis
VAIERLLAWMPAGHIAVSDITGRDLLHISGNNRLEIIPNGIDFAQIERIPPSGYESDLVFAGRLIRDKNVDILIRAVKILLPDAPGLRCVIIGDGPEMDDLKSLARDLGVEGAVRFTGFLQDPGEVIGFMKSSKVFVFPSTREGFGIAAMEALACGLPLVTSDHQRNAARSFVRAETGCLCNLTPEDFARGIRVCLENRSGMHDCCIELSCSYDWERISDRCEQYYLPGNTQ